MGSEICYKDRESGAWLTEQVFGEQVLEALVERRASLGAFGLPAARAVSCVPNAVDAIGTPDDSLDELVDVSLVASKVRVIFLHFGELVATGFRGGGFA